MPSKILSVATALPEHRCEPEDVLELARQAWPRLATVAKAAGAAAPTRYFVMPMSYEEFVTSRTLGERMKLYAEHAHRLLHEAIGEALEKARVGADEIDLFITTSVTGYVVPSLDVRVATEFGMRPDVIRLPITELGCSAGAQAISLAHRYLEGHPHHKVLVAAVEVGSINTQKDDRSIDNLIASMVFGDGAGAVVMSGEPGPGMQVDAVSSHLIPNTSSYVGFDLRDDGFHVVLSPSLPKIIGENLQPAVAAFTEAAGVGGIEFMALHAGGPAIFEAVRNSLCLDPELLANTRRTFEAVGNLSSASIFFVLEDLVSSLDGAPKEGLGIGLGPGVTVELLHLRWCPAAA